MESNLILPPLFGIFGLAVAFILYLLVMRYDGGTDKVKKIGDQIHLGAMVFMRREYTYLAMFVAVLIVLSYLFLGLNTALAVTAGALSSSLAGPILPLCFISYFSEILALNQSKSLTLPSIVKSSP